MKKVLIIGSPGAGKSTLSYRLRTILGIKSVHLDCYFWQPGWVKIPRDQLNEQIALLIKEDEWVMDGTYIDSLEMRLAAADTVIFLNYPLWLCLYGVFKRRITFAGKFREDMTSGCEEKIDWPFLKWVIKFPWTNRLEIIRILGEHKDKLDVHIFYTRKETENYLQALESKMMRGEKSV